MSSEAAISVSNLSKVYRIYERPEHRLLQMATLGRMRPFKEFVALRDVSLEVGRGETVGIIGRNGCGKSTLLQVICGTLQPSAGSLAVSGRIAALLELGAGFNGEFTGRENIYMNGAILGLSREEMDARFEGIAQFAGIGDFIERPVKTYSSGMYVRLAFAVATAVEPDILVVDEALSVGDEAFQRKCFGRIEAVKDRGGTILLVSHGAQTIVQLCDRAVLLDAGEKLLEGEPKLVVAQYQRLVNAPDADAPAIRRSIGEMAAGALVVSADAPDPETDIEADIGALHDTDANPPDCQSIPDSAAAGADRQESIPVPDERRRSEGFYDPNLLAESTIVFEERGARISEVRIETLSGERVNSLNRGQYYNLAYTVDLTHDARNIAFATHFKSISGAGVGGATTLNAKEKWLKHAKAGERYDIQIEFRCALCPGAYFANVGAYKTDDDESHFLHRILDVLAFRVAWETDIEEIGPADLDSCVVVHHVTYHDA